MAVKFIGRAVACLFTLGAPAAFALDVTAGSGAASGCSGPMPRLHVAAEAWLEPAPLTTIDDYGGSQYAPDRGKNAGVGVGFAELSSGVRGYCIGLLYRAELEGTASRDALDILHADRFGKPFDAGRSYLARYDTSWLKADGVRVRRAFDWSTRSLRVTVGLGASLLKATEGREESLSGAATATAADYALGTATWLRSGSDLNPKDFNPFVGAGDPRGWGFSTDLQVKALIRESTELDFVVMDAVGRIYWHDMRRSLRTLDNATIRYDENNNRKALVNGVDSRVDTLQRIATKYHFSIAQPITSHVKLLLADDSVQGIHFVSLGALLGTAKRGTSATFDLRTHAVSFTARWAPVEISLTTNRLDWQEATALGASVEIVTRW